MIKLKRPAFFTFVCMREIIDNELACAKQTHAPLDVSSDMDIVMQMMMFWRCFFYVHEPECLEFICLLIAVIGDLFCMFHTSIQMIFIMFGAQCYCGTWKKTKLIVHFFIQQEFKANWLSAKFVPHFTSSAVCCHGTKKRKYNNAMHSQ